MANPNPNIYDPPVVKVFEVHQENLIKYEKGSVTNTPVLS